MILTNDDRFCSNQRSLSTSPSSWKRRSPFTKYENGAPPHFKHRIAVYYRRTFLAGRAYPGPERQLESKRRWVGGRQRSIRNGVGRSVGVVNRWRPIVLLSHAAHAPLAVAASPSSVAKSRSRRIYSARTAYSTATT